MSHILKLVLNLNIMKSKAELDAKILEAYLSDINTLKRKLIEFKSELGNLSLMQNEKISATALNSNIKRLDSIINSLHELSKTDKVQNISYHYLKNITDEFLLIKNKIPDNNHTIGMHKILNNIENMKKYFIQKSSMPLPDDFSWGLLNKHNKTSSITQKKEFTLLKMKKYTPNSILDKKNCNRKKILLNAIKSDDENRIDQAVKNIADEFFNDNGEVTQREDSFLKNKMQEFVRDYNEKFDMKWGILPDPKYPSLIKRAPWAEILDTMKISKKRSGFIK